MDNTLTITIRLTEYLDNLTWDGDERLKNLMGDYFSADNQSADYLSSVGTQWMVDMVRRIYEPGCACGPMLVFVGAQNTGKSLALRTLTTFRHAEEMVFFTDGVKFEDIYKPRSLGKMQGKIIVEFTEFSGMSQQEIARFKEWLTAKMDRVQKKYQNHVTTQKRQFIPVGTTNAVDWLDLEGDNRMFITIKCGGKIDIDKLERDQEQLWAEAVYRYMAAQKN